RNARLLPNMDGELAAQMRDEFEQRGVRLVSGAVVESVVRRDARLIVTLAAGSPIATDAVLYAAGRRPNIEGLGLAEAGIATDAAGRIVVDRYFRTTCPGVYAVGDVVGPTLASVAAQHGRAAVCHALG